MIERPILFSGPMVRAILDGRKTQTRRAVKPQPPDHIMQFKGADNKPTGEYGWCPSPRLISRHIRCPYGVVGDRLWVREAWAVDAPLDQVRRENDDAMGPGFGHGPYFRADPVHENSGLTWRPSIHLPRWACRIVLEVTNVRVERVATITAEDCVAEGVQVPVEAKTRNPLLELGGKFSACNYITKEQMNAWPNWLRAYYASLWDTLNAGRGFAWATNPWVWVVEFKHINQVN